VTGGDALAVGILLLAGLAIGGIGIAIGMLLAPRLDRWASKDEEVDDR
jgi:hypothetical protein